MGTRVSYPVKVKMKAIEMRLASVPVKVAMEQLLIRNKNAGIDMDEMVSQR
ncbi:hypothetical protein AB4Z29_03455 [Paenibacillus sp. 2TAB23]|uniref:hypothetical protein n=1 Tax=Paenibacillus sp. 2TAB23 TaxID=3233004 RepID=UPI003F9C5FB2